MPKLEREEQEIREAYERGELKPAADEADEIRRHRSYAAATFRKDRRINVRLSSKDLRALQKLAVQEGIPYQTLVASVLHKFAEGRLVEPSSDKR